MSTRIARGKPRFPGGTICMPRIQARLPLCVSTFEQPDLHHAHVARPALGQCLSRRRADVISPRITPPAAPHMLQGCTDGRPTRNSSIRPPSHIEALNPCVTRRTGNGFVSFTRSHTASHDRPANSVERIQSSSRMRRIPTSARNSSIAAGISSQSSG